MKNIILDTNILLSNPDCIIKGFDENSCYLNCWQSALVPSPTNKKLPAAKRRHLAICFITIVASLSPVPFKHNKTPFG